MSDTPSLAEVRRAQLNSLIVHARDEIESFTRHAKPNRLLADGLRHSIGAVGLLRETVRYLEEGIFGGELREGFLSGLQAALDNHEERLTRLEQERSAALEEHESLGSLEQVSYSRPAPAKRKTTTPTRSKK